MRICDDENVEAAVRAVQRNKGAPGAGGMTVEQLPGVLARHWPRTARELGEGCYRPQTVKRVRIPKPDGGERNPRPSPAFLLSLRAECGRVRGSPGIPAGIDRVIEPSGPATAATGAASALSKRIAREAKQAIRARREERKV